MNKKERKKGTKIENAKSKSAGKRPRAEEKHADRQKVKVYAGHSQRALRKKTQQSALKLEVSPTRPRER